MTCPPGSLNFTAFDIRLSMICLNERSSTITRGRWSKSDTRMMTRSCAACGCISDTHSRMTLLASTVRRRGRACPLRSWASRAGRRRGSSHEPGRLDVLEIFLVALVADRPKRSSIITSAKPRMAFKRRADLVADLGQKIGLRGARRLGRSRAATSRRSVSRSRSGRAASAQKLGFARPMRASVSTSEWARLRAPAQGPARPEGARLPPPGSSPRSLRSPRVALGCKQHQQTLALDFRLMVAEQALAGSFRDRMPHWQIERDGAVGRRSSTLKLARRAARAALGSAARSLALSSASSSGAARTASPARRPKGSPARGRRPTGSTPCRPHDRDSAHVFGAASLP